jgi:ABC-type microcin C transport system duplicated ATPase subunit YejF
MTGPQRDDTTGAPEAPLLEVRDLVTSFSAEGGRVIAVDGLSFSLARGETLGIVGESGSGKSVTQLSILGLLPTPPARIERGTAIFDGVDLLAMDPESLRRVRGNRVAMIFQDPMTSLNPFLRISTPRSSPRTQIWTPLRAWSARSRFSKPWGFPTRVAGSAPILTSSPAACASAS